MTEAVRKELNCVQTEQRWRFYLPEATLSRTSYSTLTKLRFAANNARHKAVLEELFRRLIAIRVKPHYLFHVDPVRAVRHFATGVERGLEILRYFRPRLSSLAVPTFAIDLPEGGGKVALQPQYGCNGEYYDIHETRRIRYETAAPESPSE